MKRMGVCKDKSEQGSDKVNAELNLEMPLK